MDPTLQEKISALPQSPGCYLMKGKQGEIIYVGKAVNLRSRVRSYFTRSDTRAFVQRLDEWLADVEVILTSSEKDALLLENELIKRHKPRFNVMLRDDKNYISLRLDVKQPYPRLEVVRRIRKDGARYFGPYSSASAIRETLRVVNRYFQLRTCSDSVMNNRRRPCLQYQIKRCPAPCVYDIPVEQYRRSVEEVILFLEGRADELEQHLHSRMKAAAAELKFEEAAQLRDQIRAIERSLQRQQMVATELVDQDVLALYREGPEVVIQMLNVRKGKLLGGRHFSFKNQELPDSDLLSQFVRQYYDSGALIPSEVLLPVQLDDSEAIELWLGERRAARVYLRVPQRGGKVDLVRMARENAEHNFREWQRNHTGTEELLARLKSRLRLSRMPFRIECFDNSHLQGTLSVGSKVSFVNGSPEKTGYRHYKVRTAAGDDDFQMMHEVLGRRLSRGIEENDLPDLIVVDGGKGQLNVARQVLKDKGLEGRVDLIALAEGRVSPFSSKLSAKTTRKTKNGKAEPEPSPDAAARSLDSEQPRDADHALNSDEAPLKSSAKEGALAGAGETSQKSDPKSLDRVFLPGRKNPVLLRANSAELYLLQRLRDEAHRFANTFQRKLRRSANFRSVLREIPGVGEVRQKALLRHFGSLRRIREASAEELSEVQGLSSAVAQEIWRFFHENGVKEPEGSAEDAEELAFADAGLDAMEDPEEDPDSAEENARFLDELAEELGAEGLDTSHREHRDPGN